MLHGETPKSETIDGNIETSIGVDKGMFRESEVRDMGEVLKWDRDMVFRVYSLM
jgi:hypothetical protein